MKSVKEKRSAWCTNRASQGSTIFQSYTTAHSVASTSIVKYANKRDYEECNSLLFGSIPLVSHSHVLVWALTGMVECRVCIRNK